ncbi:MAG: LapA family protein [Rhizobacter sp.]|nr:LapA family protein [Burkholderiaceae bacterium]MCO5123356.1 LapA family protein [Rhizobacter sp.]
MNLRSVAIVLALVALVGFAALNWTALMTPAELSLGFAQVQAPLGVVMLGISALLCVLFIVYLLFQQAGALLEARRYAKEMKAQRELADRAEASRFTELRAFLEVEMRRIEAQGAASKSETDARFEHLGQTLQAKLDESTRTLSAYIGEVEDKIDRALAKPPV